MSFLPSSSNSLLPSPQQDHGQDQPHGKRLAWQKAGTSPPGSLKRAIPHCCHARPPPSPSPPLPPRRPISIVLYINC